MWTAGARRLGATSANVVATFKYAATSGVRQVRDDGAALLDRKRLWNRSTERPNHDLVVLRIFEWMRIKCCLEQYAQHCFFISFMLSPHVNGARLSHLVCAAPCSLGRTLARRPLLFPLLVAVVVPRQRRI
jgi:hypothetical protein